MVQRLTADGIEANVKLLVAAYLAGVKTRPQDAPVIDAGVALITNVLINLNDVACAMNVMNND